MMKNKIHMLSAIRSAQTKYEEKSQIPDKKLKGIVSIVKLQAPNLWERLDMEVTHKFEMWLKAVEGWMWGKEGGMLGPEETGWNHWSLTDPCHEQYYTSSKPWSNKHPVRPCICSSKCMDKLPTSYTVSKPKQHIKISLGFWRPKETNNWWRSTGLILRPGSSWTVSGYKRLQQL